MILTCTCMTKKAVAVMNAKCKTKGRTATEVFANLSSELLSKESLMTLSFLIVLLLRLRVRSSVYKQRTLLNCYQYNMHKQPIKEVHHKSLTCAYINITINLIHKHLTITDIKNSRISK